MKIVLFMKFPFSFSTGQRNPRRSHLWTGPCLLGLPLGRAATSNFTALGCPILPHDRHARSRLPVLHSGRIHHGRRRRISESFTTAKRTFHLRHMLRVVRHWNQFRHSRRNVRVPVVRVLCRFRLCSLVLNFLRSGVHLLELRR